MHEAATQRDSCVKIGALTKGFHIKKRLRNQTRRLRKRFSRWNPLVMVPVMTQLSRCVAAPCISRSVHILLSHNIRPYVVVFCRSISQYTGPGDNGFTRDKEKGKRNTRFEGLNLLTKVGVTLRNFSLTTLPSPSSFWRELYLATTAISVYR